MFRKKQQESNKNATICYICKKNLKKDMRKIENISKLNIIAIIQVNIEILSIVYVI